MQFVRAVRNFECVVAEQAARIGGADAVLRGAHVDRAGEGEGGVFGLLGVAARRI